MNKILTILSLFTLHFSYGQLDSLQKVIAEMPDSPDKVEWMTNTAFDFYTIDPFITEQLGLQAIELAKKYEDHPMIRAKAYHIVGISFWTRDLYQKAISYYHQALPLYEQANDVRRADGLRLDIANIYGDIRKPREAIEMMQQVRMNAFERKDTLLLGWSANNIGSNFNKLMQFDSALKYYQEGLTYTIQLSDTVGIALGYNNVADVFINKEVYDKALENLLRARQILRLKKDVKRLGEVYVNLGISELALGNPYRAQRYLDSAFFEIATIDSKSMESELMEVYSEIYMQLGQYERAIYFLRESYKLKDSISGSEVQKQVEILELQYENEKQEKELAVLAEEEAREESVRNIAFLSAGFLLILAGLITYIQRQRIKKNKIQHQLKMSKLQEDLRDKNKEISSYTLNFIQKNELMEELKTQINELKKQSTPDTNKQLNRINRIVDETFRSDEEWDTFRLTFEQMHDGFFSALKDTYPDLGNAELKLCALLRLNMNLKESARILGISPDSVKTARYRLRKKFGLKTEDNLVDFLIRFEQDKLVTDQDQI